MKLIFVCSPYRDDVEANTAKAIRYCYFAYNKKVVPYAPHLHNTQFLDEDDREERLAGIELGLEVMKRSDELWVFGSKLTEGMKVEIEAARRLGIPIKYFTDKCEEVSKR
ncbi:DUF4406 domain-containing protein [Desulfosporosinus sp.]|uniref:DUF7768 domain-containing protein n=1 Tax=Desulfosporosinus sp. TaxID=157907 RepID=UPI0025BA1EFA|nr:DUF4406 domain-containing protein [Desulfosporosinus sp.]MBC2723229.1 DUF4406 domain-containing protein [Desulfosporosinus sp.]MBC2727104.1 DUF4406 domain-containing protein [Desulfosporosinus sp.]